MKKITFLYVAILSFFLNSCLKEDDAAVEIPPISGTIMQPEVGGGTQPNQVWIDFSTDSSHATHRNDWDLGFYTGEEFYVILNNSIMMAAGAINSTDIDAVNESDFASIIDIINPGAGFPGEYIDDITGNYYPNGTAIDAISSNPEENKVYLLKLGYETFVGDVPAYSTYTAGEMKGYKKIRILRNDSNSYKVQIADLNDTSHEEFIIEKNPDYHFSFFNIEQEEVVTIQPTKEYWDICFTVWNNIIEGHGTYIYPDFVVSNKLSGVGAYMITTDPLTLETDYNNFKLEDVDPSLFDYSDHRVIGGTWRSTVSGTSSSPIIFTDRFYVVRDTEGNYFKLRFISMLNENNERGYPIFEYNSL